MTLFARSNRLEGCVRYPTIRAMTMIQQELELLGSVVFIDTSLSPGTYIRGALEGTPQ